MRRAVCYRQLTPVVVLGLINHRAYADNCGDLSDCWAYIAAAVVVAVLLAGAIFFLFELAAVGELVGAAAAEGLAGGAADAVAGMAGELVAAEAGVAAAEAAAAAALTGAESAAVVGAATGTAVSAESAIAAGAAGARLGSVLTAIQSAFTASAPRTALQALGAVRQAVASVGLEPGVMAGMTAGGTIVLQNVGNVTTYLFANGQILVMRGAQTLLNLLP